MENIIEIRLGFPDEGIIRSSSYEVIKTGEYHYKLMHNDPLSEELSYGTIIEVEPEFNEEGAYQFKKVAKISDFTLAVYGLPSSLNRSELMIVGNMIVQEGGYWEVIFGGIGYVNLPKNSALDVNDELNKLIKNKKIRLLLEILESIAKQTQQ